MRLRLISEKTEKTEKHFFSYEEEAKEMWAERLKEAQDESDIHFDTENNDTCGEQKTIRIDQNHWDHYGKISFNCELYSAGGDWEHPTRYFRCQLKNGPMLGSISKYGQSHFVFIPNKKDGNVRLTKRDKGGWGALNNDEVDEVEDHDDKACWKALEAHLKKLVDDEIKQKNQTLPESNNIHAFLNIQPPLHQSLAMLNNHKSASRRLQKLRDIA